MISARYPIVLLACLALPGCYVKTYGNQSVNGGATATVTSTQVAATAGFSSGRASFTSGQPVSPTAPGGHVSFGSSGAVIMAVGLALVETVQYVGARFRTGPPDASRATRIADTCSCYKKEVISDK